MPSNFTNSGEQPPLPDKEEVERLYGAKNAQKYVDAKTDGHKRAMLAILGRNEEEDEALTDGRMDYAFECYEDEDRYREARKIVRAKLTAVPECIDEMSAQYDALGSLCMTMDEELTKDVLSAEKHLALGESLIKERTKMLVIEALIVHGSCTFKKIEPYMRTDMAFAGLSSEALLAYYYAALNYLRKQKWITIS